MKPRQDNLLQKPAQLRLPFDLKRLYIATGDEESSRHEELHINRGDICRAGLLCLSGSRRSTSAKMTPFLGCQGKTGMRREHIFIFFSHKLRGKAFRKGQSLHFNRVLVPEVEQQ